MRTLKKDLEFTDAMIKHLKAEKEKIEYTLQQIDIQIESLEDFQKKVNSEDNTVQLDLIKDTKLKGVEVNV